MEKNETSFNAKFIDSSPVLLYNLLHSFIFFFVAMRDINIYSTTLASIFTDIFLNKIIQQ